MTAQPHTRRAARIATAMEVYDAGDEQAGPWATRDLSATGLFLLAPGRWSAGNEVSLILAHREARVRVRARATQATDEGVGFRFLDPPAELEAAVLEMMSDRFAEGDDLADRRREIRWPIDLPVVWRADEAGEFRARAQDLSPTGARILCAVKPSAGAVIYLLLPMVEPSGIRLPFRALMGTRARVVQPDDDGFGVEFLVPSEIFETNLLRLLAKGSG